MLVPAFIFKALFLVTAMLLVGVATTRTEVVATLQNRAIMSRSLIANLVAVPVFALLLIWLLPLSSAAAAAIFLLGLAPGGINAIQFSGKVKGELNRAAAILAVLTVISLVLTSVAAELIPDTKLPVKVPYLIFLGAMFLCCIFPIAAGAWIRTRRPSLGQRLIRPLNLISTLSFIAAALLSSSAKKPGLEILGGVEIAAILVLILGSMAIGWAMGGADQEFRRVLAITTSNRNAAICLLIAMTGYSESGMDLAVLAFLLLAIPSNLVFTLYHTAMNKRRKT
jgi:BASS family bile acid:Na+ symporter